MKNRELLAIILCVTILFGMSACGNTKGDVVMQQGDARSVYKDAHVIVMNKTAATLDGEAIEESDYTWHVDPSVFHIDVNNAPAEYYTGTKLSTEKAAYIDHELYYFPKLDEAGFRLVNYDGEQEYAYYYTEDEHTSYIFATLPKFQNSNSIPTHMMHTEEEAGENKVLHIVEAGTYILEGEWDGQIWIDLGARDDTFADPNAKVTVILNGVDINCSVAPGVIFYSAYECDNTWEDRESYSADVNTAEAGVNVIIADGSGNLVSGQNIYRMLKTKYKDDASTVEIKTQKKLRKIDAAFYSYVSMNINGGETGSGKLEISSSFEGLDSELHLTILGGNITINSQDDGINVNEDNVSVVSLLGGTVTINAALGAEGDGIDSNGYVVIDGGNLNINNVKVPDNAVDSEDGVVYKSGSIRIDGKDKEISEGTYHEIDGQGNNFFPRDPKDGNPGEPPERQDGKPGEPPERQDGKPGEPPEGQGGKPGEPPEGQEGKPGEPPKKP